MSLSEPGAVPSDLVMQFAGILPEGESFIRRSLFEELVSTIPKESEVRTLVYQSELAPGVSVPWHIHNGPLIALLVQGEIVLQFTDESFDGQVYHYKAGDAFIEPVGVMHRTYNPNPDVPMLSLAFQLTPPDRDHIVIVEAPPGDVRPEQVPRGVPQPQATPPGRLAGSADG